MLVNHFSFHYNKPLTVDIACLRLIFKQLYTAGP